MRSGKCAAKPPGRAILKRGDVDSRLLGFNWATCHSPATSKVPMAPNRTEPTGLSSAAVAPDPNPLNWLEAPLKTEFMALTRPRFSSGVSTHQGRAYDDADHCMNAL